MKTQSPDTSPEAEKVYFDLLRRQTPSQRLSGVCQLTASAIHRERRWLARQHPEWSEQEVALQWAAIAYGEDIANRVRQALEVRDAQLRETSNA